MNSDEGQPEAKNTGIVNRGPVISLCVCTYNRADSLARTLESLCAAQKPEEPWELIIVDNNSKDHTRLVVNNFTGRLPLRYVFEGVQGLSAARNRGVKEFRGSALLFADDDVRVDAGWLTAFEKAICAFPEAGYFGGRVIPEWNGCKPRWLREPCLPSIDGVLVWFDHGPATRLFLEDEPTPFGASFGLRRSVLECIGKFRLDLGCNGTSIGRSEETDFLLRAKAAGAKGAYVGEALSWHFTDPQRLTLRSLYRYGVAGGKSYKRMSDTQYNGSRLRAGLFIARGLFQLTKGRGDRFRQCIINAGIQMGQLEAVSDTPSAEF
jgi:glucosyl-dolichyl phosphate glucuronosyltransferase